MITDADWDALESILGTPGLLVCIEGRSAILQAFAAHRLLGQQEIIEQIKGPAAWLERWAQHVGACPGDSSCTCGLTLARYEIDQAIEVGGMDDLT